MAHVSARVQDLLRLAAAPAELLELAPDLRIGGPVAPPPLPASSPSGAVDAGERAWLVRDGVAHVEGALPAVTSAALVRAVDGLRARELPATFVYAFDEPWALGEQLRARISALTSTEYVLVEDAWAWRIAPGEGGWPPHRGVGHVRLDRDAPEVVNVWVALSDVPADRACMHAIPLDEDPGYPGALDRLDAPLSAVRALPVAAGDALFWNANVLHWGGRCAARASGPRVSCSFSLLRNDATARFPELTPLAPIAQLDLARRMDVLARMVLLYGHDQPDVSETVREWAGIAHGLSSRFSRP